MKIIGHRGASREAPENTIGGFCWAIAYGVTHFELDLRSTLDGEPVVIHDETLLRTTRRIGRIYDIHSKDCENYNAALRYSYNCSVLERVPLLKEVLPYLDQDVKSVQLEIKTYGPNRQIEIINSIQKLFAIKRKPCYTITSEDELALRFAKNLAPRIPRGIICKKDTVESCLILANKLECKLFIVHKSHLTIDVVKQVKAQNLELCVYTVNCKRQIKKFKKWGVDGIITDYPIKFLKYQS